jgi:hypothetical protein
VKPTIGRIVHYTPVGERHGVFYAAIITFVGPDTGTVDLAVFRQHAVVYEYAVQEASEPQTVGFWNWPPRV